MKAALVTPCLSQLPFHPSCFLGYGAAILAGRYDLEVIDLNAELHFRNRGKLKPILDIMDKTQIVSDGFRAGAMLDTFFPAAVTLDLKMPGLGGLDVLKFVRDTEHLKDTKILVVSALPQKDLDEALRAGADDILVKPFDNKILLEKVQRLAGVEQLTD